jgi:hypothetical protein
MSVRIKGVTIHIRQDLLEKLIDAEIVGDRTYRGKVVYVEHYADTEGTTYLFRTRVHVQKRQDADIWDVTS